MHNKTIHLSTRVNFFSFEICSNHTSANKLCAQKIVFRDQNVFGSFEERTPGRNLE